MQDIKYKCLSTFCGEIFELVAEGVLTCPICGTQNIEVDQSDELIL